MSPGMDVVSPSQAEIKDLTATGSRADPVQALTQDRQRFYGNGSPGAATSATPQTTASPATSRLPRRPYSRSPWSQPPLTLLRN